MDRTGSRAVARGCCHLAPRPRTFDSAFHPRRLPDDSNVEVIWNAAAQPADENESETKMHSKLRKGYGGSPVHQLRQRHIASGTIVVRCQRKLLRVVAAVAKEFPHEWSGDKLRIMRQRFYDDSLEFKPGS
eukprot:SAG11_NODE_1524_length_4746_cov_5.271358_4_plen_131_part_00